MGTVLQFRQAQEYLDREALSNVCAAYEAVMRRIDLAALALSPQAVAGLIVRIARSGVTEPRRLANLACQSLCGVGAGTLMAMTRVGAVLVT